MKESKKANKLFYENDTLSVLFNFYKEGLVIGLTNKSGEQIKIKWDELRMAENGIDKKIEHIQISKKEIIVFQPPSIISPKSECTDLVVYADNIYYLKQSGKETMKIKDFFPSKVNNSKRDSIENLKGQRITLLFPIEIKNLSHSWIFHFLLEDIKSRRTVNAGDIFLASIPL